QAVANRAHKGFDMNVVAYDPYPPAADRLAELGVTMRDTVEEVLAAADFVSLHCPATPENRHLMNAARLKSMQPHAFLINTARGDVVDEAALVAALEAGTIKGAGLDVFEQEPKVHPGLAGRDDVVLLPHLGSATL